jgi:hypothetical protein
MAGGKKPSTATVAVLIVQVEDDDENWWPFLPAVPLADDWKECSGWYYHPADEAITAQMEAAGLMEAGDRGFRRGRKDSVQRYGVIRARVDLQRVLTGDLRDNGVMSREDVEAADADFRVALQAARRDELTRAAEEAARTAAASAPTPGREHTAPEILTKPPNERVIPHADPFLAGAFSLSVKGTKKLHHLSSLDATASGKNQRSVVVVSEKSWQLFLPTSEDTIYVSAGITRARDLPTETLFRNDGTRVLDGLWSVAHSPFHPELAVLFVARASGGDATSQPKRARSEPSLRDPASGRVPRPKRTAAQVAREEQDEQATFLDINAPSDELEGETRLRCIGHNRWTTYDTVDEPGAFRVLDVLTSSQSCAPVVAAGSSVFYTANPGEVARFLSDGPGSDNLAAPPAPNTEATLSPYLSDLLACIQSAKQQ